MLQTSSGGCEYPCKSPHLHFLRPALIDAPKTEREVIAYATIMSGIIDPFNVTIMNEVCAYNDGEYRVWSPLDHNGIAKELQ